MYEYVTRYRGTKFSVPTWVLFWGSKKKILKIKNCTVTLTSGAESGARVWSKTNQLRNSVQNIRYHKKNTVNLDRDPNKMESGIRIKMVPIFLTGYYTGSEVPVQSGQKVYIAVEG